MGALGKLQKTAFLGLGSNLGDRLGHLSLALQALNESEGIKLVRWSSVYETEPWGYTDQPRFLNCAVQVTTSLSPGQLLDLAKSIEVEQGRVVGIRYGPRPIDVDILLVEDLDIVWDSPDLQIPHAHMCERAFVLVPLAEIASEVIHPGSKTSIGYLASIVEGRAGVTLWGKFDESYRTASA